MTFEKFIQLFHNGDAEIQEKVQISEIHWISRSLPGTRIGRHTELTTLNDLHSLHSTLQFIFYMHIKCSLCLQIIKLF